MTLDALEIVAVRVLRALTPADREFIRAESPSRSTILGRILAETYGLSRDMSEEAVRNALASIEEVEGHNEPA